MLEVTLDNIIFSLQNSGGISVVWAEHIARLINDEQIKCDFIEYDNAKNNIFRKDICLESQITLSHKYLCLKRYLNVAAKKNKPYIFHSSYYRTSTDKRALNVTTVHDFTYEYFSSGLKKSVHSLQKKMAVMNSDALICISENTKNDLLKFYPKVDPSRISVIYNGVSDDFHPLNDNEKAGKLDYDKGEFAIFIGARGGYKNFGIAVEACAYSGTPLVIVGGGDLSRDEESLLINKLGQNKYIYEGRINNARLNFLYNSALCLLYPSKYEGFGIPVLESQKAGCPVIASSNSSIPEIIGNSDLAIKDIDAAKIADMMIELRTPELRDQIRCSGIINAGKYSWDNTYDNTIKVYRSLI